MIGFLGNLRHQGSVDSWQHQLLEDSLLLLFEDFSRGGPIVLVKMLVSDGFDALKAWDYRDLIFEEPLDLLEFPFLRLLLVPLWMLDDVLDRRGHLH